jgi:protein-L-isoaspartate(D-aspartate) O-methyltransferase
MENTEPISPGSKRPRTVGIGLLGIFMMLMAASFFSWIWKNLPAAPELKPAADVAIKENKPDLFDLARRRMVETQMRRRDITDPRVLEVMEKAPRHLFVPPHEQSVAYDDRPLPIGYGQTISQPYVVALMTQAVRTKPESRALEVGAGSGYQAAVLAELCKEVYAVEIIEPLATAAQQRLAALGYKNITFRCGDGYRGWKEHAPFDVIIVTAAPEHVPQPLVDQLAVGGRMAIPVGRYAQELLLLEKLPDGSIRRHHLAPVAFVPMTGEAQERKDER